MRTIQESYKLWEIKPKFVHELGHYIAGLLNFKHTNLGKPTAIKFYPCEAGNEELCGHVEREKPQGYDKNKPVEKERLAEFIGSTIMGCVFQAYYVNSKLEDCLFSNGLCDNNSIRSAKDKNLRYEQMKKLSDIENHFLEVLKNNDVLEFLNLLEPLEYIKSTEIKNQWYVDLSMLDNTLNNYNLELFEFMYLTFLEELRQVIFLK